MSYLSSGLNLARGRGLYDYQGHELTFFPPGLPSVVAIGDWFGIGTSWTVRLLNCTAFAAAVTLGFILLRRHVRSQAIVVGCTILLAVSVPLLMVAYMAWTEPVFIVICLALILVLERMLADPRAVSWSVALAAAFVWAGFLFRYAGLSLVACGGVTLLVGRWNRGWRDAISAAAVFVVLSVVVPIAWMVRTHGVDGTLMGPRSPSSDGIVDIAKRLVDMLGAWVLPPPAPSELHRRAGESVVALCGGLLLWLHIARRRGFRDPADHHVPSRVPLVSLALVYLVYLVAAKLTTAFDLIDNRLLSPAYVPLVVLGAIGLDTAMVSIPTRRRLARSIVGIVLTLFVLGQAFAFARETMAAAKSGGGYAATVWSRSELVAASRVVPTDANLFSNRPDGLWVVLGREPSLFSPRRPGTRNAVGAPLMADFLATMTCRESYLAWFPGYPRDYLFTPDELTSFISLTEIATYADGTMYRIESSDPTSCQG